HPASTAHCSSTSSLARLNHCARNRSDRCHETRLTNGEGRSQHHHFALAPTRGYQVPLGEQTRHHPSCGTRSGAHVDANHEPTPAHFHTTGCKLVFERLGVAGA